MPNRKAYWARQVLELTASGLSRTEFCRRRDIPYRTMSTWMRRLARDTDDSIGHRRSKTRDKPATSAKVFANGNVTANDDVGADGHGAADVRALSFVELPNPVRAAAIHYEVVLSNGRSIRLGADFDPQALTRLMQVVDVC